MQKTANVAIIVMIVIGAILMISVIAVTDHEKTSDHDLRTKEIIETVPVQETQTPDKIDWKSEWKKVVPEIETVKRSQNEIKKYTADECQFYVDNTNQRFEIFEGRNNMILNELDDDPNQKVIDRLIRDNTAAKRVIMNQVNDLVARGCINESEMDGMQKLLVIPGN